MLNSKTAEELAAYRRALLKARLPYELVQYLVRQAAPSGPVLEDTPATAPEADEPRRTTLGSTPFGQLVEADAPATDTAEPEPDTASAEPTPSTVVTTAMRLGAYRNELREAKLPEDLVHYLLRDAGCRLHEEDGLVTRVHEPSEPVATLKIRMVPIVDHQDMESAVSDVHQAVEARQRHDRRLAGGPSRS